MHYVYLGLTVMTIVIFVRRCAEILPPNPKRITLKHIEYIVKALADTFVSVFPLWIYLLR